MSYGSGEKISVSFYTNNNNIAILLDEGRYDILTTNGDMYLGLYYIGIRSDEPHKVSFAFESELIQSIEPVGSEPSGYININHYAVTDKLKQMATDYEKSILGG